MAQLYFSHSLAPSEFTYVLQAKVDTDYETKLAHSDLISKVF